MFLPSSFASNKIIGSVLVEIIIPSFSITARIIPGVELLLKKMYFSFLISSLLKTLILSIFRFLPLKVVFARGYNPFIF